MPRCWAVRARSSRSSKWYAGSNELRASDGLLAAAPCHSTIVRITEAFASRAVSSAVARSAAQRNEESSWKPTRSRPGIALSGRATGWLESLRNASANAAPAATATTPSAAKTHLIHEL